MPRTEYAVPEAAVEMQDIKCWNTLYVSFDVHSLIQQRPFYNQFTSVNYIDLIFLTLCFSEYFFFKSFS